MQYKLIKDTNLKMRKKSIPVELPLSLYDRATIDFMLEYLKKSQDEEYATKHNIRAGVGLAAIQIGELKRMFAIYYKDGDKVVQYQLINPEIVESSIELCALKGGEGCLSVDKEHKGLVHRHNKIKMKAFDALTNKDIVIEAEGYDAIVLQHEYDHLDGIFFYDRIDKNNPEQVKRNEILI